MSDIKWALKFYTKGLVGCWIIGLSGFIMLQFATKPEPGEWFSSAGQLLLHSVGYGYASIGVLGTIILVTTFVCTELIDWLFGD
jgi:hypothetical protein